MTEPIAPAGYVDLKVGEWEVVKIGGAEVPTRPLPTLAFGTDGRITGSTGINRLTGGYTLIEGHLELLGMATTRMAGEPAAMETEARLLQALGDGGPVEVAGDEVVIGADDVARAVTLRHRRALHPSTARGSADALRH